MRLSIKTVSHIAVLSLALLVVPFISGCSGNRYFLTALEHETQVNLSYLVINRAQLQTGNTQAAIDSMEARIDSGLINLTSYHTLSGRSWEDLPERTRRTLVLLKAYRSHIPSPEPSEELKRSLSFVPESVKVPQYCNPALRKVLGQTGQCPTGRCKPGVEQAGAAADGR